MTPDWEMGYSSALDDIRRTIWVEISESKRPQHIERKGLDRALEIIDIIDNLAAARKAQPNGHV